MNQYQAMNARHQAEVDKFPFMFAFSPKQFEEGMVKLGLKPTDTDKILSIGGGGYIRKTDRDALHEMLDRHAAETQAAVDADETGEGFVRDMFVYELDNHEFSYTMDTTDTLEALGLTAEEVYADPKLRHGLREAKKIVLRRS